MKYLLIILILSSCSLSQRATKKINWLTERGFIKNQTDTVWQHDTIHGFRIDTLVKFDTLNTQDTLTVVKDGVKVRTIIQWKERTVIQEVIKQDTIINNFATVNTTEITNPDKHSHWQYWAAIIGLGVALLGVIFIKPK